MASPTALSGRFFYGWIVLAASFLITFLASGTMMAFGIFINPMADDMGWSHSALSFTYAISAIVSGLGILGVGTLMHAHSVRTLLLLGTVVQGIGLYATSTVTTVEGFYFWYGFVTSLGRSVFLISTAALITRWFERRQGFAMGLTMAGNGLGPFIFSPLVTWVILRWDWQTAFVMLSVTVSAASVLACLFVRNYPHEMGLVPFGADRDAPPPVAAAGGRRPARSVGSVWRDILRMEGFWTLAAINFFCCMCHSVPLVHIVVFAQHAGLSSFASAWVLALMSLSAVAGRVALGRFRGPPWRPPDAHFHPVHPGDPGAVAGQRRGPGHILPVRPLLGLRLWRGQYPVRRGGAGDLRDARLRPRLFRADVLCHGGHGDGRFPCRIPL